MYLDDLQRHIIYLEATTPNKDDIKYIDKLILDYIDYFIYEEDMSASIGYENLQNDIEELFDGFELNSQFNKINSKDKKGSF